MEELNITCERLIMDCKVLAKFIEMKYPMIKKLVAITRGGLFPTLMLSEFLEIKNIGCISLKSYNDGEHSNSEMQQLNNLLDETWDSGDTLFVDDLFDSGNTIKFIKEKFPNALTCTIYYKENESNNFNTKYLDFYSEKVPNIWINFFFEQGKIRATQKVKNGLDNIQLNSTDVKKSKVEKKTEDRNINNLLNPIDIDDDNTFGDNKKSEEAFEAFDDWDDDFDEDFNSEESSKDKILDAKFEDIKEEQKKPDESKIETLIEEIEVLKEPKKRGRKKKEKKVETNAIVQFLPNFEIKLLEDLRENKNAIIEAEQIETIEPEIELKFELSKDQKKAIQIIESTHRNVILTGKAGAGKSTIINILRKRHPKWGCCSTTGKSALLINADTVDSFFKYDRIENKCFNEGMLQLNMKACDDTIIIDEASMVGKKMLDFLLHQAAIFDKRLILVGDWAQTAPVKDDWFFPIDDDEFLFLKLTECHRQESGEFLECLDKLRNGVQDSQVNKLMLTRILPKLDEDDDSFLILFGTNKRAKEFNQKKVNHLLRLELQNGTGNGKGFTEKVKIDTYGGFYTQTALENMKNNSPFANDITFAIGCKILLTYNNKSKGFVNGDTGILLGYNEGQRSYIVKLDRNEKVIEIERMQVDVKNPKGQIVYTIFGYPMKLGYALTVHKSQGMTIPKVYVDIDSMSWMHMHGIVYVALSRVRKIEDLFVSTWKPNIAVVDPVVLPYI